ncbi:MAG: leucyl/phenylalanyl-tRNA--protein transferase [Flavobacteriales bacterium]
MPKPELAEPDGLLAVGGDLRIERLILAYENGIFPWFNPDQPMLWWSPPKRMVLYPSRMKVSKSLKKSVQKGGFELRIDTNFEQLMRSCGSTPRKGQEGTWVTEEMIEAYSDLFNQGLAHSFETWKEDTLVGGLYGVSLGRAFFGESMFSTETDASKVAFYHLHEFVSNNGFQFIDCQLYTDHLASLGAIEVERELYLRELKTALAYPDLVGSWSNYL